MPSATTISVNDSSAVAHVFRPISKAGMKVSFVNEDSNTAAGNWSCNVDYSLASNGRKTDRFTFNLAMPTEQLVDGEYEVSDIGRVTVSAVIPTGFTAAQRADLAALLKNFLSNATIEGVIADRDPIY